MNDQNGAQCTRSHSNPSFFSPYFSTTLKIKQDYWTSISSGIPVSSSRHNMIIASSGSENAYFYDIDTLLPLKGRDPLELGSI